MKLNENMQEELINKLKPKIKSMLYQTEMNNREDLEQELLLFIIKSFKDKKLNDVPSFFELIQKESELTSV